ncbi:formiminoglutamase [Natranaerovirga pectinivora]|uniref:Formiminoglutamase n=1 Tax=Natranaerovirga pectinivora TaxID=682400 RepID=A0A4R3MH40_9FIRM|nr:N-formylglutamate amidohydrolase [Natranaerovirga pectinivora]TCT12875.1 formiminoglutamase [Natranaerovirga pectinivora]
MKLPILISVPHGGLSVPDFLIDRCLLSPEEILLDSDTWARELYDLKDLVEAYVDMDISRIVIDLNRNTNDLPPNNPDGIVKTIAVDGSPVWKNPEGLNSREIEFLIDNYYDPYHRRLEELSKDENIILGVDCHSMLDIGPTDSMNRPLFCISNRGNALGEMNINLQGEKITAPSRVLMKLKSLIEDAFSDIRVTDREFVAINSPFYGGYITKHQGSLGHIPWIQIEVNKCIYLPNNPSIKPTDDDLVVLRDFRNRLYKALCELSDYIRDGS